MIRVLFYVVGEEAPKLTCEKEAEGEKNHKSSMLNCLLDLTRAAKHSLGFAVYERQIA